MSPFGQGWDRYQNQEDDWEEEDSEEQTQTDSDSDRKLSCQDGQKQDHLQLGVGGGMACRQEDEDMMEDKVDTDI